MKRFLLWGTLSLVMLTSFASNYYYNQDLMYYAEIGDLAQINNTLKKGADINTIGSNGLTPLMLAISRWHNDAVEFLLNKGANVNVIGAGGYTALHVAAGSGNTKAVELLLKYKADTNIKDNNGSKAIDFAVARSFTDIVDLLDIDDIDGNIDFDNPRALRKRLKKLNLPPAVYKKVSDRLELYEKSGKNGPEAGDAKKYLQAVFNLPWGKYSQDNLDISKAAAILDEDHFGLKIIKDRILDVIAVRQLKSDGQVPIICFVGPPGIGKTSLVKSIARALGRKYHRISLGGLRDVSELKGHNSTYIGSQSGQIMQAFTAAQTSNPVILLDEIDKLGNGNYHGNPQATMLEILDPNQNNSFHDDFLGFPYDISAAMFIATANDIESIPGPLRDRMEIIDLNGYTLTEKVAIAKNYLIKKAKLETGLENQPIKFSDELITYLAQNYSREAGVRELERVIKKLCSKAARILIEDKKLIEFDVKNIEKYLGKVAMRDTEEFKSEIGVSNGLAWTSVGGEVLKIETLLMPGTGKLFNTGSLGKVMKESIKAALSYIRAYANKLNINPDVFNNNDLHVHLPAGGIPKDGPSAGIALITSLVSLFTGRAVDTNYAMTGEINLRGNVTAIGGLKEKILAAKRNNIAHVIAPKQNMHDLDDSPEVLQGIDVVWVDHVDQVFERVLIKK